MSRPRADVVQTDAGWHGRIVAGNGEPVWSTEVLTRKETVLAAVEALCGAAESGLRVRVVDERTEAV